MSVLYKALQKAQKENEQRQPAAVESDSVGATSAMRLAAPSINWRLAGIGVAGLLAIAIGAGFFFLQDDVPAPQVVRAPTPQPAAPALQPPAQAPGVAPAAPAAPPVQSAATVPNAAETPAIAPETPAPAQLAQATPEQAAPVEADPVAAEEDASTDAGEPVDLMPSSPVPRAASPKAPARTAAAATPMPQLAPDSPARVLNPPINIKRDEYDFSGVGDAVQVRRVSQQAQDNVTAGYNALVRGDHEMALGFYERALQQEPRSMLAQLGRGSALQKLGRFEESRAAYERALKLDPNNREALTNLTVILAEREPGEALKRLQNLEREYPSFSPIKAQIGLVYAKLGSFEPALDYLRRAATITPDAPMYQYNLALVLDRLDRREQAVASYERVLSAASMGRLPPDISTADIERRVRYLRAK